MRKFVATAAIAASAAAILLPAAASAATVPLADQNLTICANTVPNGGGIPNGDPVFVRVVPQNNPAGTGTPGNPAPLSPGAAVTLGIQDGQCQSILVTPGRVKVERLTSAASQKFCGPAAGDYNCYGGQNQLGELSWSDIFSAGRTRANMIELVTDVAAGVDSYVTFWTASAW